MSYSSRFAHPSYFTPRRLASLPLITLGLSLGGCAGDCDCPSCSADGVASDGANAYGVGGSGVGVGPGLGSAPSGNGGPISSTVGSTSVATGGSTAGNTAVAGGGNTTSTVGGGDTPTVCTDTPRSAESCSDAKDWGFCGQDWFAGYCDATCGICTMGGGGTDGTGPNSGDDSGSNVSGGDGGSTDVAPAPPADITPATTEPRVDNPYVGATGYINPEWKAKADAEPGGNRISNTPTGVWMDRIAAIDGTGSSSAMGLRDHLDEALAQGAGYIQIVIYDLPGRDCAALSSNGELGPTEINRYRQEYIDPIAKLESDPAYSSLRIINIIEIDSLPNLVTNTGSSDTATDACDVMKANGNYEKGVQYALGQLYKAGNTYNYVDAGHHGWIGWEDNFGESAQLFYRTAQGAEGGVETVTGFITNTANYSALEEPLLTLTEEARDADWVDFNDYVDELSFAKAFREELVRLGFGSSIGMLIDTSRNGWGGPDRPTAASTAGDVNTRVNESRVDRRIHLGNWCNQEGAGLGERPQAVDSGGIDAYVWIKPPGESDGASQFVENDQGKGVDGMCDPTYTGNPRNANNMSGALPQAPLSGAWFSAQFQELMANAYPPLD